MFPDFRVLFPDWKMNKFLRSALIVLSVIPALTGCRTSILYPPIANPPTYNYTPGKIVWHELVTGNPEASMKFYGSIFGWTFEKIDSGRTAYYLIRNQKEAIGGLMKYTGDTGSHYGNSWVLSLSMQDLSRAMKRCTEHGGSILKKTFSVPGRGKAAVIKDNQGAVLVLIDARYGDPFTKEAAPNTWLWSELWSNDPAGSSEFYNGLAEYSSEKTEVEGKYYWVFRNHDRIVSSMLKNPLDNSPALWVPYIRVDEPGEWLEKAKANGAILLLEPTPLIRKGNVAVLMDPGGAIFCIQKWPSE